MDLSLQLGSERRPVALEILTQVVVVRPEVLGHRVVDRARPQVPELRGIAVGPSGAVCGLPDGELLAGPCAAAEHRLELALLPDADPRLTGDLLFRRDLVGHPFGHRMHERVRVAVDVGNLVMPEVDRVRVEHPRAPKEVGMVHLQRQRFPPSGRPARERPRPGLADHPEARFEIRNELLQQRIAVPVRATRDGEETLAELARDEWSLLILD